MAVPIGNLDDLSSRARDVLSSVAVVAAEDTRHYATLARHHGLPPRAVSYHDHNEDGRTRELVARLAAGDDVALVSDAGTPLISDPGYKLVRAAREAGLAVHTLPGPSAVIAALTLAGLPTDRFLFAGFLPPKAKARADAITELVEELSPVAKRLECEAELAHVGEVLRHGPSYVRQRSVFERTGSLVAVVDALADELVTDTPIS